MISARKIHWRRPTLTYAPAMPAPVVNDPEKLRSMLHAEIDRAPAERLAVLHQVALQWELDDVTARRDAGFGADAAAGKLDQPPEVIREARAASAHGLRHKYEGLPCGGRDLISQGRFTRARASAIFIPPTDLSHRTIRRQHFNTASSKSGAQPQPASAT